MTLQDFTFLVESGLLRKVERMVVEGHRDLYSARGKPWSRPVAYRWLRYEDPAPVNRLGEGLKRLRRRGVKFDAEAVEKACLQASRTGFLN
jgi:hypothetical protein